MLLVYMCKISVMSLHFFHKETKAQVCKVHKWQMTQHRPKPNPLAIKSKCFPSDFLTKTAHFPSGFHFLIITGPYCGSRDSLWAVTSVVVWNTSFFPTLEVAFICALIYRLKVVSLNILKTFSLSILKIVSDIYFWGQEMCSLFSCGLDNILFLPGGI